MCNILSVTLLCILYLLVAYYVSFQISINKNKKKHLSEKDGEGRKCYMDTKATFNLDCSKSWIQNLNIFIKITEKTYLSDTILFRRAYQMSHVPEPDFLDGAGAELPLLLTLFSLLVKLLRLIRTKL